MNETGQTHDWDFESGKLPLDFANTAVWHASTQPKEMLQSYADLIAWSKDASLLTNSKAKCLLVEAEINPNEAEATRDKAIELREVIYRVFSAIVEQSEPKKTDLALLNAAHIEALKQAQIVRSSQSFTWIWLNSEKSFDQMLWPIALSAVDLLTTDGFSRVGKCADDRGCGYLFFDTSRNRGRRWCSMESCGNRAKARRFYKRHTQEKTG